MISAELLLVQRVRYDALELSPEAVAHEFLDIHDRHIVFATEPVALFAYLRTAKVATVPSWHLLSCAVILPKAIFEERLREVYFREFPICIHAYCDGRTEQPLRVDDMQQRNLLLPDFNHRVIESPDAPRTLREAHKKSFFFCSKIRSYLSNLLYSRDLNLSFICLTSETRKSV